MREGAAHGRVRVKDIGAHAHYLPQPSRALAGSPAVVLDYENGSEIAYVIPSVSSAAIIAACFVCVHDCDVVSVTFHNYDFMYVNSHNQDIVSIVIQDYPRLVEGYKYRD